MNKLSKNIIALSLATTLVLPMTGCNANLTIGGKEIFNLKDNKVTEEFDKFGKQTTHTDEEAVNAIINGNYTITYNNQDFTVPMADVLNTLFPNCEIATQAKDENTWLVKFQSGDNYIVYRMSFLTGTLVEQELCYNGTTLTETNDEAHNGILQLIVTQIIDNGGYATNDNNQSESTLKCKHCGKDYKKSESDASNPDKYCSSGCNTEANMLEKKAKEEKAQDKEQKTCKWCNRNKLPSGAGDNDKCSECQQEYWNYVCSDCGKDLSLNEYWSTAGQEGFCASCYEKYKQATSHSNENETEHKTYYCDRCGKDITFKNFLQNVGGYDFLCEGCAMELGY